MSMEYPQQFRRQVLKLLPDDVPNTPLFYESVVAGNNRQHEANEMNRREMALQLKRQERESKRTIEERHALTMEQTALYQAVKNGLVVVYNELDGYWVRADNEARVTKAAVTLIQRGLLKIRTWEPDGYGRRVSTLKVAK